VLERALHRYDEWWREKARADMAVLEESIAHIPPYNIQTHQQFVSFVLGMATEYNETDGEGWENSSLPSFLEAIADVTEARFDEYVESEPSPNWKVFGQILHAARYYE
jgi:hypothetical protein